MRCFSYYNKSNTYQTDVSYISERDETDLRLTVTVATTTEAAKQSIFAAGEERSDRDERGRSFLSLVNSRSYKVQVCTIVSFKVIYSFCQEWLAFVWCFAEEILWTKRRRLTFGLDCLPPSLILFNP